ncbi:MAG: outer membrane lipid asymmetry maintenance protein MlaD [Gammaproteobacteria bacterium]|nr:outer membrane lipid asymmetry maintenance protein MlaD [Gammaproteobacteria bacterium]
MTTRITEIWVGLFVAGGMAALFMLAMQVSNLSTYSNEEGYDIEARFEDASGLKVRSPVTMAGVTIGRVKDIVFDDNTLQAVVIMRLDNVHNRLPDGTSASIYTAGLLGEKYVGLEPGSSANECEDMMLEAEMEGREFDPANCQSKPGYLAEGSKIQITQGSMVLEKLIGQFVSKFLTEGDGKAKDNAGDNTGGGTDNTETTKGQKG